MVALRPPTDEHRPAERVGDGNEVVGLRPLWLWQVVGIDPEKRETKAFSRFSRWLCQVVIAKKEDIFDETE